MKLSEEQIKLGIRLKPNDETVIVIRDKAATQTESGIYMPESESNKRLNSGVVLAIGEGCPECVVVGGRLSFSMNALNEVTFENQELLILEKDNINFGIEDGDG